jgi:sRNA-binding carbon storage regulator CsrA
MLIVTRKRGERVRIRDRSTREDIWIEVRDVGHGRVSIGIDASVETYRIDREELLIPHYPEGRS